LATLKFLDLDLKDHTVRVTGKGNKTRVVPIGRKAVDAINHWLRIREAAGRGIIKFLFPNNQGEPLSVRTIQYRLTYWSKKQGLPQNVHPHMLRHSFASHILQSSGDLRSIQEMLGHANISTTQVYTHLDWQHLAQTYDNAHPRAKRKENN
jgi:integrase/recombinase XerC